MEQIELDYPACLPNGVSEAKFVEIVREVCRTPAYRFHFGYYGVEDLQQEAFILAITFLRQGKFKPRGEKPMELQLKNFLRVWIYNRLNNLRRDKCCKYPNNGGSNQTKFNLIYALPIYSQELQDSEIFARDINLVEELSKDEVKQRLLESLNSAGKHLFWRYMDGKELNKREFRRLQKLVLKVLTKEASQYL